MRTFDPSHFKVSGRMRLKFFFEVRCDGGKASSNFGRATSSHLEKNSDFLFIYFFAFLLSHLIKSRDMNDGFEIPT